MVFYDRGYREFWTGAAEPEFHTQLDLLAILPTPRLGMGRRHESLGRRTPIDQQPFIAGALP
jgi:hypothetical protein